MRHTRLIALIACALAALAMSSAQQIPDWSVRITSDSPNTLDDLIQGTTTPGICMEDGSNCPATAGALPLTGGEMLAEFIADALGIEFEEGDALTDCSTFSATGGGIFYDDSENIFKKCQNNTLTDLDTGGAVNTADIADVNVTQTELAELETINGAIIQTEHWALLSTLSLTLTGTEVNQLNGVTLTGNNTGDNDQVGAVTNTDICQGDGSVVQCNIATLGALNTAIGSGLVTGAHTDTTKLPTAGGTLTGEVTVDNLGLEFAEGDTLTDCSTFSVTGGGIFYDDSEGKFKKCQDNTLSDLDATGALSNIVEDTTPELGGNLDVLALDILSAGGLDIDLHSDNDLNITLGDAVGVDDLNIRDSVGSIVAGIDSDGGITGNTFAGITSGNLLDKSATETVAGNWNFSAELGLDDLGLDFTAGDALTDCSTFSATAGGIFFDDSEGVFKKCQDNVLTDLDTGGMVNTADIADVSVTQTEFAELETIGATVISAADWTAVAALVGTNTGDQTTVSGNAGTVTHADAASDTTTFVSLGTAATGSLAPATDAGLAYNASTDVLTVAGGVTITAHATEGGQLTLTEGVDTAPAFEFHIKVPDALDLTADRDCLVANDGFPLDSCVSHTPATADISDVTVTATELEELATIGATSISAADWTAVAALVGVNTGDQTINTADIADASVTLTEFEELATIGATVISAADWTAVAALVGTNTGDQTINTADIADATVTLTEFEELATVGTTTISANQWIALGGIAETLTFTELDLLDGITVLSGSNTGDDATAYLPLTGGTLSGALVADEQGVEFTESDDAVTCAAGDYWLRADLSETTLKKCLNGVETVMDTTGGTPSFSDITGATNTTAAMVVGTGASLGVSGSGTISATGVACSNCVDASDVAADVATQAEIDLKADLAGPTFTGTVTTDDLVVDGVLDLGTRETFVYPDATPDVGTGSFFLTDTEGQTVTDFDGAGILAGQIITVESAGATVYDCTTSGFQCGSADITTAAGDITTWHYDGTDWHLIAFTDQSTDMGTDGGGASGWDNSGGFLFPTTSTDHLGNDVTGTNWKIEDTGEIQGVSVEAKQHATEDGSIVLYEAADSPTSAAETGTLQMPQGGISSSKTWTLPDETGTVITSVTSLVGEVTGTIGATVVADSLTVTGWELGAATADYAGAGDDSDSLATTEFLERETIHNDGTIGDEDGDTLTECVKIKASAIKCDSTTGCVVQTRDNTNFAQDVATFSETDQEFGTVDIDLPANLTGTTIDVYYVWESDTLVLSTNDDLCMDISAVSVATGGPWESASFGTAVGIASTGGDTDDGDRILSATGTVTPTGLGASEGLILRIARDTDATPAGCADDNISNDIDLYWLNVCYEVDNIASGE